MKIIIIYVTYPSLEVAKEISQALLNKKLVACSNIFPITSMYWWNQSIENEEEYVAVYKTKKELFPFLEKEIKTLHPYEVPCIAYWKIKANKEYKKWIFDATKNPFEK